MAQPTKPAALNWREYLRISIWIGKLYASISRKWTTIKIVAYILGGIQGTIYSLLFGIILDRLIALSQTGTGNIRDAAPLILIFLGYALFTSTLYLLQAYANRYLRVIGRTKLRVMLYTKINSLGIQTLEQPEVVNKLNRALDNFDLIHQYFDTIMYLLAESATFIASGIVILRIQPLLIPLMVGLVIPRVLSNKYYVQKLWLHDRENTEGRRRHFAIGSDLTDTKDLKEITLAGAHKYLLDRYSNFFMDLDQRWLKIRMRGSLVDSFWSLVSNVGIYTGYLIIFNNVINKVISIGDTTFQISALGRFNSSLDNVGSLFSDLQENGTRVQDVFQFLSMQSMFPDGTVAMPKSTLPPEILLQNASFKYPNSDKLILNGLNLHIKPGEKIAIVGHNGAGKTTLVKLIIRFYQLTSGSLEVNGTNINDLKIEDWYKNTGVLFQDFNTYEYLTAKENIYVGLAKGKLKMEDIEEAAKLADADKFIDEWPNKYNTILNERFSGGIRPSGGMWQKIAIARFFYRNAPLLIFDEPTAAIDAVSEYKIFNRIYKFFKNKTVIIISHRFSTVRNADRIIVMDKGKVAEEGTHAELMALGGKYAHAFKLQAEGYQQ